MQNMACCSRHFDGWYWKNVDCRGQRERGRKRKVSKLPQEHWICDWEL